MVTAQAEPQPTVNLDLGNAAELNMVCVNPAHITHVRLAGTRNAQNRKMEIYLTNGNVLGMSFDDPEQAEAVFGQLVATIRRTAAR
jgi:hypothetical protein